MITAVCRGGHRDLDTGPRSSTTATRSTWSARRGPGSTRRSPGALPEPARSQMRAGMVARSRYVGDRMLSGGFSQYVLLGAGLESFAWRHPDLLDELRVIEIDHPSTQHWKRERAGDLGLPEHPNHVFVPVDLEHEPLGDALDHLAVRYPLLVRHRRLRIRREGTSTAR